MSAENEILFEPELFNPLYWHLDKYLNDTSIRYIFIYGGASAAKTYTTVQNCIVRMLHEEARYMILRKYGSDLEDSIFNDFKEVISDWELGELYTTIKRKITSNFGGVARFRGLDDSEKIKGLSKVRRVILDEFNQFVKEDFKQVRKRLRGISGQQIIALWNPISEDHWIKKDIIDTQEWVDLPKFVEGIEFSELDGNSFVKKNKRGNAILIKTTYLDNFWIVGHPKYKDVGFIDQHTIDDFEFDKENDYEYYRVYALGEWGRIVTGLEFYKDFKPANIFTKAYNNLLPLHISFDENVNPYMGVTIWQTKGNDLFCIDEITLRAPKNTLNDVIMEIHAKFPAHEAGMFIYGDATSNKSDVKLQKGYNLFTLITTGLARYRPVLRVPSSNPSVFLRGVFINSIFRGQINANIYIAEHCTELITDLNRVKLDNGGEKEHPKKVKEKVRDKQTGITYEKYGHTSDSMDYFVCKFLESDYNSFRYGSSNSVPVDKLNFDIDLLKF